MKKFVVLLAVVAMTFVTGVSFAAEVTVGGEVSVRSRDFWNLDMNENATDSDKTQQRDTQNRIKLDINAKAGDVKGKLQIWNDFETWNGLEKQDGIVSGKTATTVTGDPTPAQAYNNNTIGIREAWISFPLPGIPVNVTAGHQLLSLGHGWFFRSMHYGSDAWVVSTKAGDNTFGLVDVKVSEGNVQSADDIDAYVLFGALKLNPDMALGFDVTKVQDRKGTSGLVPTATRIDLYNIGVNFNGKLGPVALKAQVDYQMGDAGRPGNDLDFSGNQIVVQGSVPAGPATVNFTVARGSGNDGNTADENEGFVTFSDIDPHYTFLYEYKMPTAAGAKNTVFSNTTAIGVGASFKATPSVTVAADFWHLMATEDIAAAPASGATGTTDEVGQEIDVKVNWKVADNLAWNWVAGIFMPGDGMGKDDATGVQGILSFSF
jgi:hypothetical protein